MAVAVGAALLVSACRSEVRTSGNKGRIILLTDSMFRSGGTDTIRFGHLRSGEIAVLNCRIENGTPRPVVLTDIRKSCGCTSIEFDNQPVVPGEDRQMQVTFDSRGEHGWQIKTVDLLFAGARKPLRLFIEAEID